MAHHEAKKRAWRTENASMHYSITQDVQAWRVSASDYSPIGGNLQSYLSGFLLSCRVNELSKLTLEQYSRELGYFVKFIQRINILVPADITPHHIRLFLLGRETTNRASTINKIYRVLNRFFNWLVEETLLEQSPMTRIKPPRVPKTIIKPFLAEDINRMLFICEKDRLPFVGARNRAIILTLLDTGLRRAELVAMKVSDIDFDHEIITIMGKGSKERVVRIGKRTQAAILKYLLMRNDQLDRLWLSQTKDKPLTQYGVQLLIRSVCKRAGITGVRCSPHTLRHTCATFALENGAGEFQVQSLLGQSTLAMTRRYTASLDSKFAARAHKGFSPVDNLKNF